MTSFYNGVPHSSSVSEISSAPPSPVSCNTATSGNAPRYGVLVPNRVFVGGIASNTTETELQELFSQFGNIKEIKIISDRSGVCKGYGFITFETEEEAKKVQHQPDSIVLKERRLNIAPAVMKQQPFGRPPYDVAPSTGALLYHNGTTYTYQNGMAFFTAQSQPQTTYSTTREPAMYAAPFSPGQATSTPSYPQIMYTPYTQPMPYLATGQQYQYPTMPFDYFKPVGPASSPYIYATPPGAMNGALNSSQSPSPGYGQSPSAPAGSELYYNGVHPTSLSISQHQPMYPVESSPAHSEEWNPEQRQTHTPVVSLLKLHEEGFEEMEIKRTPKKSFPSAPSAPSTPSGPGGPRPRSRRPGRPGPSPSQGRGSSGSSRGAGSGGPGGSLAGQRSTSSPHLPSTPNSCLHRSTSLSPSNQVSSNYMSSRQPPQGHHQHHQIPHTPQGYHSRRGVGSNMRGSGQKTYPGHSRSNNSYHSNIANHNSGPNQIVGIIQNSGHSSSKTSPKNSGESERNGAKGASVDAPARSPSFNNSVTDKIEKTSLEGGAGDATVRHSLPLSPPSTPLPQESGASGMGGGDGDMCQKMKALAM